MKYEKRPEFFAMIALAREMFCDEFIDGRRREDTRFLYALCGKRVKQKFFPLFPEPLSYRQTEAVLFTRDDFGRKTILHELAQNVFTRHAAIFVFPWHTKRKINNIDVKKWRAHFKRMIHAHPVYLREKHVKHIHAEIEVRGLQMPICVWYFREVLVDALIWFFAQYVFECGRKQCRFLGRIETLKPRLMRILLFNFSSPQKLSRFEIKTEILV